YIDQPRTKWDLDTSLYRASDGHQGIFRGLNFKLHSSSGSSRALGELFEDPIPSENAADGRLPQASQTGTAAATPHEELNALLKGDVFRAVLLELRGVLGRNAALAGELEALLVTEIAATLDGLIECLVETPPEQTLANIYKWLRGRSGNIYLDDIRKIANAVAVLGVQCDWVQSVRPLKGKGTIDVPQIVEGRTAELLVGAILGRPARYTKSGGRFVGDRHLPLSSQVPASGITPDDQARFYREQLINYFRLSANHPQVDEHLYRSLKALWSIDDPVYVLLEPDSKLPEYLRPLTQYRWQEVWFTLRPSAMGPEDEQFHRLIEVVLILERIYGLIDDLSQTQGKMQ
ncbi:MAG: hypothetical protein ACLQVD_12440, partial [Capsulimonadaceae bacterium]